MGSFLLDEQGVWFEVPSKKEGEPPTRTWVCSPLDILAITRDHDNENHGKLLRFYDYDRVEHRWSMPLELLAGDGVAYRQALLSGGMRLAEGRTCRELLHRYIQSCNPEERMRCVPRLGWYGELYVLPNETIGAISDETIIFR